MNKRTEPMRVAQVSPRSMDLRWPAHPSARATFGNPATLRTTGCSALLVCALVGSMSVPTSAEEHSPRTISVAGQGRATAPPDMATINTGVITRASTAGEALQANNRAVEQVMEVLRDSKIASKDIQTSNFDIQPEYRRGPRGDQRPEIVGYRVTNQVTVRVRNLPDLGEILDALVKAGSNQISGISFGIDDATGVLNQARNRAVADARSRAELYAHAAGVQVGKVLSISEQSADLPRPQMAVRSFAMESAGSVPVASGEQEVQATVSMVFELKDRN